MLSNCTGQKSRVILWQFLYITQSVNALLHSHSSDEFVIEAVLAEILSWLAAKNKAIFCWKSVKIKVKNAYLEENKCLEDFYLRKILVLNLGDIFFLKIQYFSRPARVKLLQSGNPAFD